MTQPDEDPLALFLASVDATGLGEGDPAAGANLLAAMAVTLANLARPGSGLSVGGNRRVTVGGDLLVSGALSSALVVDEVLTGVGGIQNHLAAHLRSYLRWQEMLKKKQGAAKPPAGAKFNAAADTFISLQHPEPQLVTETWEGWVEVLAGPPNPHVEDLAARSKFLVTTARAGELDTQLRGLHLGQAVVFHSIAKPEDFGKIGETCTALMDGGYPADHGGGTLRGRVLLVDREQLLPKVAVAAGDNIVWLGRLIWLCDGDAGPEPPAVSRDNKARVPRALPSLFGDALLRVLAKRLDNHSTTPVKQRTGPGFLEAQARWMSFLRETEPQLPGITGTARSLLATLVFGVREILAPCGQAVSVVPGAAVESLSRLLVLRMANARAEMLFTAEQEWRTHKKTKILEKLGKGHRDPRLIYRNLTMPGGLCRDLLSELKADGLVRCVNGGREWELVESARQNPPPAVDV